jgi:hypothetical protein
MPPTPNKQCFASKSLQRKYHIASAVALNQQVPFGQRHDQLFLQQRADDKPLGIRRRRSDQLVELK